MGTSPVARNLISGAGEGARTIGEWGSGEILVIERIEEKAVTGKGWSASQEMRRRKSSGAEKERKFRFLRGLPSLCPLEEDEEPPECAGGRKGCLFRIYEGFDLRTVIACSFRLFEAE
ncbi:hypothetical protein MUK42_32671 [Musa troglodytarum]|uniref:Uncharacterized protein n=1 Tax=Musa troglodytarum TaxID=320322 RepID=A0A9E7JTI8_9LILI|nr:hypothetical protein MUK42_32671 [Musa troglodytarum]